MNIDVPMKQQHSNTLIVYVKHVSCMIRHGNIFVSDAVHRRFLTAQTACCWMETMYKFVQAETCTILRKRALCNATHHFRACDRLRLQHGKERLSLKPTATHSRSKTVPNMFIFSGKNASVHKSNLVCTVLADRN